MPRGVDSNDLRASPPVGPLGAVDAVGLTSTRRVARTLRVWALGAALVAAPVQVQFPAGEAGTGWSSGRQPVLGFAAARAQSSPISELWRELETLRVQWRVEVQTLRIDIDRFRQRVAKRRWERRRLKNESGEP